LKQLEIQQKVTLIEAIPSECSQLLKNDKVDIALMPVGAISDFEKLFIVSDYCISCDGSVRTVKLFSNEPVEKLQQIVLDSSSRSSNLLIQLLCKYFWNKTDLIFTNRENRVSNIKTGFVKIGDEVFDLENHFDYEYDLGQEWKAFTGLPFVFAIWVSKTSLKPADTTMLNTSFQESLDQLSEIVNEVKQESEINFNGYFEKNIFYQFDESRRNGLKKFLELTGIRNPF
jgi:chorismate dehydratase